MLLDPSMFHLHHQGFDILYHNTGVNSIAVGYYIIRFFVQQPPMMSMMANRPATTQRPVPTPVMPVVAFPLVSTVWTDVCLGLRLGLGGF